jgi:hypothetical protein
MTQASTATSKKSMVLVTTLVLMMITLPPLAWSL